MRRTTLILLIVLILVLAGSGIYVWLQKDKLNLPWSPSTDTVTNTVTNIVTNTVTNTTPTSITLPREVKGDTTVSGVIKIGSVDVVLNSQQRQTEADGVTAEKGQTFVLVYFDPIESANISAVDQGIRDAKLTDGKTSYPLQALKIASTYIKGDRGYLRFAVPENAKNLQLQLGTGPSAQSVKLP